MYLLLRLSNNHPFGVFGVFGRCISTTSCVFAEPLKKKKRLDPALLKRRTEKKLSKLSADINRLEKAVKQFKPIIELHLTPQVVKQLPQRIRNDTDIDFDVNAYSQLDLLMRLWSVYRKQCMRAQQRSIISMVNAQNRATNQLNELTPELYLCAITIDDSLMPYTVDVVRTETPANLEYQYPDGKLTDITKNWVM